MDHHETKGSIQKVRGPTGGRVRSERRRHSAEEKRRAWGSGIKQHNVCRKSRVENGEGMKSGNGLVRKQPARCPPRVNEMPIVPNG